MRLQPNIPVKDSVLRQMWTSLSQVINGLVGFGDGINRDNVDGNWVSVVTPGAANTNFTINHNLGRIPVGYLVMSKTAACDVYTGTIAATTTQLTLKATAAGVTLNLFII